MSIEQQRDIIIAIGDNHLPFTAEHVFKWILDEIIRPNKDQILAIVDMGDKYDFAAYSRFPKSMNVMTPKEETQTARRKAVEMWAMIHEAAPEAKKYQLKGNHDERLAKKVLDKMPEIEHLIDYDSLWNFDNVETIHDSSTPLIISDWAFIHGHTNIGGHLKALDYSHNVCTGHVHSGGTIHHRVNHLGKPRILTELNCGYLGDPYHESLIYRPMKKFFKWTWGVGVIDSFGGRFIPYNGEIT